MGLLGPSYSRQSCLLGVETQTRDYETLLPIADIKTELRLTASTFDALLGVKRINAIFEVEKHCNVSLGDVVRTATYEGLKNAEILPYLKAHTLNSITIDGVAGDVNDYTLTEGRIEFDGDYLEGRIVLNYTANIDNKVPVDAYKEALYILIASNFDQEVSKKPAYQILNSLSFNPLIF